VRSFYLETPQMSQEPIEIEVRKEWTTKDIQVRIVCINCLLCLTSRYHFLVRICLEELHNVVKRVVCKKWKEKRRVGSGAPKGHQQPTRSWLFVWGKRRFTGITHAVFHSLIDRIQNKMHRICPVSVFFSVNEELINIFSSGLD
jgi:hypothetical protein